ncbi:hypothetical protein CW304_30825 [Bacillus sp. UFRGS-B20]|nr:hypothetical protein CW304_30825 [Bacillus sp. UFRGS-B20]
MSSFRLYVLVAAIISPILLLYKAPFWSLLYFGRMFSLSNKHFLLLQIISETYKSKSMQFCTYDSEYHCLIAVAPSNG